MVYHIMQKNWKNMLGNCHGWSSNMDTPRKQYNLITFLAPSECAFTPKRYFFAPLHSMGSFICWYVHLPHLDALGNVLFFLELFFCYYGKMCFVVLAMLLWWIRTTLFLVLLGHVVDFLGLRGIELKPHSIVFLAHWNLLQWNFLVVHL